MSARRGRSTLVLASPVRAGGPVRTRGPASRPVAELTGGRRGRPGRQGWPSDALLLGVVVVLLLLIGLIMVLSASSVQAVRHFGSSWAYFARHALWVTVGAVAMAVTVRVDYRRWRAAARPLLLLSLALLVAVLVPGVGRQVNGARSWLAIGPVTVQPAELTKLALVLFVADLLAWRAHLMDRSQLTLRPVVVVVGLTGMLLMLQPDLGTAIVMGAIAFWVLFVAGVPMLRLAGALALASAGSAAFALAEPYRRARLLAFLHPTSDPLNTGYNIIQSLTGVASGGLTGIGLGESRAKWGFLPNAHTDFIFAILSEELGLVGALVVVALLCTLGVLGVRVALRAPDRLGTLLAAGITAWILTQALVNVGGVVGVLPITGLTLPFISFGGSSLVVTMAATGILINVARRAGEPRPAPLRAVR
ncbi:MAG: putative lipid II flippase FtsW [Acidimicrobiales bacterium]